MTRSGTLLRITAPAMCRTIVWPDGMIENSGRSPRVFKTTDARASMTKDSDHRSAPEPATQYARHIHKKPLTRCMHRRRGRPTADLVGF